MTRLRIALAALAFPALACQTLLGTSAPMPSLSAAEGATSAPPVPPTASTPIASATPAPTLTPSVLLPPPTSEYASGVAECAFVPGQSRPRLVATPPAPPTPYVYPTAGPFPTAAVGATADARHWRVFEDLWETVNREYVYPDFHGQDWNAIGDQYRAIVQAGLSDEDFWAAMDEMLGELGDEHSGFQSPAEVQEDEQESAGHNDYVGVGILHMPLPEKSRSVILVNFPGGAAEQAGLRPHDSLLAVNGQPIIDENGELLEEIRGPAGAAVTLTVQTPGQAPRDVTLIRRRVTGPVPIEACVFRGARVGYVLIPTFADETIPGQIEDILRAMTATGSLAGLIVDNRVNEGGLDTVLKPVLAFFVEGVVGHFVSRAERRPLEIAANDVGGSQAVPLVVLVGTETVSYGEVFSGVLQDLGRATIVGGTSYGNVETLWSYDFEDGSRAWIARETFEPLVHAVDWEETGIVPDVFAPAGWDEFTPADDPGVAAALDVLSVR